MDNMMRENYFIQDWLKTVKTTVKLNYPDIKDGELEDFLCSVIDNNIKVPIATLDNNYIHTTKRVDVLTLMQWIKNNNFIIAGNGTIFKNHDQEYNPSIHFLIDLKKSRDNMKSDMKKLDPKTYEYAMKDMGQLNEKLLMNSDYGAGGSPITYFYNLYCAVSTTATGQSMISTAMCCFEDFFSDNVKFIDFDDCSQYISNIVNEPFNGDLSLVEDKKAHEVFERLKEKFIEYKEDYNYPLFSMLLNIDQDNLNRIYYKNNLYSFARLPKVKKLLFKIIDETDLFLDPNKPPKENKSDLELLWSWIDEWVVYNYFAFNRIGRLTCDPRDTVCTIDTDSNMLCLAPWFDFMIDEVIKGDRKIMESTYKNYTYEINGEDTVFEGEKMLVYKICNTITYIASQVIAKHLKKFAITSGVPEMYHNRIHMKSEFLFRKMLLTTTKKRYMAKIMLREGTVFEKREIKGLDFLKSECNDFTREFISNLMNEELLEKPTDDIVVKNIINGARELAESVRGSLERGEKNFLTPKKCKEAAAYKNPWSEQSFRGAYAWNMLYPDMGIEFPDTVDIVQLNIHKIEDISDLEEKDPEMYNKIKRYIFESKLEEVRKKALTVLAIPKNIPEIPEWCRPYINYDKIINDNTTKLRPLLEALGVKIIQTDSTTDRYSNIIEF
jgi:hypothetical protein